MLNKNNADKIAKAVENTVYSSYSALGNLGKIDSALIDIPFKTRYEITEPLTVIYYCRNTFKYYLCRILLTVRNLSMKNRTLFNACGYYLYKVLREAKNLKEARKMKGDNK